MVVVRAVRFAVGHEKRHGRLTRNSETTDRTRYLRTRNHHTPGTPRRAAAKCGSADGFWNCTDHDRSRPRDDTPPQMALATGYQISATVPLAVQNDKSLTATSMPPNASTTIRLLR